MSNLTHTELVEKVADIIDPKSKGPMREYRITQRELAESLAAEIVSTIAEILKEPTEAMIRDDDGYELRFCKVAYLLELGWIGDSEGRTWAKDLKESTSFPTREAADAYADRHPDLKRDQDGWLRTKYDYGQARIRRSEIPVSADEARRAMLAASPLHEEKA